MSNKTNATRHGLVLSPGKQSMEHKLRPGRIVMDTSSVIWSEEAYRLQDFPEHFELPQLVCVEDGYYDEKDETTLSRDDVLTLHILQKNRFYKAEDRNGQEINIPVNLAATVETVSSDTIKNYNSIQELINVSAKKVKSVHDHPWLRIRAGDILQVQEVNNNGGVEFLRFSFISKTQDDVNIPTEYQADFQVLPDITKLWLTEVEKTFELPVRIRFTDETLKIKPDEDETSREDLSTIADLGDVTLQSIQETDQFVASTKIENRTMVLKIPAIADITVRAGVGIEEGDYTYVEVCKFYHERARLYQLDDCEEERIRIGETDAKVERIYEFVDDFSDDDDGNDYEDVPPEVPTRIHRAPLHPEKEPSSDNDEQHDNDAFSDESDDYEETEISPPIPNRDASLQQKSNVNTSKINNQSLCTRIINTLCCSRTPNENQNNSATKTTTDIAEVYNQGRYVAPDSSIRSNTVSLNDRPNLDVVEEQPDNNTAMTAFPERLDLLNVEEVSRCLRGLNMEQHVEQFRKEQINGSLFVTLNEDLLISLGVTSKFQRAKLLKFIGGWRPDLTAT